MEGTPYTVQDKDKKRLCTLKQLDFALKMRDFAESISGILCTKLKEYKRKLREEFDSVKSTVLLFI